MYIRDPDVFMSGTKSLGVGRAFGWMKLARSRYPSCISIKIDGEYSPKRVIIVLHKLSYLPGTDSLSIVS